MSDLIKAEQPTFTPSDLTTSLHKRLFLVQGFGLAIQITPFRSEGTAAGKDKKLRCAHVCAACGRTVPFECQAVPFSTIKYQKKIKKKKKEQLTKRKSSGSGLLIAHFPLENRTKI